MIEEKRLFANEAVCLFSQKEVAGCELSIKAMLKNYTIIFAC